MDAYLEYMRTQWRETLGLPLTEPLLAGWALVPEGLARARETGRWVALPLPTGSGKTQALTAFCASRQQGLDAPGILVVTRFKAEATKLAQSINRLAQRDVALASHSESHHPADRMRNSPVLVITHSAYRLALRAKQNQSLAHLLEAYEGFQHGSRQWVIIDEELDWLDAYEVEIAELKAMCAHLTEQCCDHSALECLRLLAVFAEEASAKSGTPTDHVLTGRALRLLAQSRVGTIKEYLLRTEASEIDIWSTLDKSQKAMKRIYIELLDTLQKVAQVGHGWVSTRGNRMHIRTAQSLLKAGQISGLILDATAGISPSYGHHSDLIEVMDQPVGIRRYDNVTLHVSSGHKLGKEYIAKHATREWNGLSAQLAAELPSDTRLLICTHLDAVEAASKHAETGMRYSVAHWGALDGKNEWKRSDVIVIYGLPYLDNITPTNSRLATWSGATDDWFSSNADEESCGAMRQSFKDGFIAKSVIQAINRTRSRQIIDTEGNCDTVNVYLMIPGNQTGNHLISAIKSQMPGIQIRTWSSVASTNDQRTVKTEDALVSLLSGRQSGTYSKTELVQELGVSRRTFERLSPKLQSDTHSLPRKLEAIGVEYRCSIGAGTEACFVKH